MQADGREASLDARRVPIWLAGATCSGGEAALTDCPGVAFGADIEACGLDTTLVLSCFNGPDASAPAIMIMLNSCLMSCTIFRID